jgi:GTP-binding protein
LPSSGSPYIIDREKMKITESKFVGSYPGYENAPRPGLPEIAVGGRSNVGKSSLINSLLNRKNLAQTSKDPGKTKLLNYFEIMTKGGKPIMHFVDLPGYGYAKVSIHMRRGWKSLVEGYIEGSPNLKGFLLLVDSRRGVENEEIQLVEYLVDNGRPVFPVLTKCDKLKKNQRAEVVRNTVEALTSYGDAVFFPVLHSAKNGTGNDMIWRWMNERISDEG